VAARESGHGITVCPGELEEVMGNADHCPFLDDLAVTAEEELSEASCL
jgi:hypothetical protein